MKTLVVLALGCLLAVGGDGLVRSLGVWDPKLPLEAARRPVVGLSAVGGETVLALATPRDGLVVFVGAREGEAARKQVTLSRRADLERAMRAPWLLTFRPAAAAGQSMAMALHHLDTGESRVIQAVDAAGGLPAAALSAQRAAVLDATARGNVLRIYRLPDAWLESELTVSSGPAEVFLSFAAEDRLLLVGYEDYRVTPVWLGTQPGAIREEPTYELRGAEVEAARRRTQSSFGGGTKQRGRVRMLTLAHLTSRAGRDLFVFAPFRAEDGVKLVEFDGEGEQAGVHRLQLPVRSFAGPWLLRGGPSLPLVDAVEDEILLAGQDGRVWRFARP
jgi:hypothetical protein